MPDSSILQEKPILEVEPSFANLSCRIFLAQAYLQGEGLEIGALNRPMPVPPSSKVKYVDRLPVAGLKNFYPEMAGEKIVEVDIVDDGETLQTVADNSQDFVIASHVLEHCENPIQAFGNWLRVLKEGGILYLIVPDMRYTFDKDREPTTLDHILKDHRDGPEWSRRQHYVELLTKVNKLGPDIDNEVDRLIALNFNIHFHAWRQSDLFELMAALERQFDFDVLTFHQNGNEAIFIIRKASPLPLPDRLLGPLKEVDRYAKDLEKQLEEKNRHISRLEELIHRLENGRFMRLLNLARNRLARLPRLKK